MFVLAKPGSVGDFVAGPGPVGGSRECGAVIQEDHDPALVGNDLLDVEMIEGTDGTTENAKPVPLAKNPMNEEDTTSYPSYDSSPPRAAPSPGTATGQKPKRSR